jgi:hypothetical protein
MNLDLVSIALFILERVAERADITTMPELADKLASATGTRADKKTLRAVLLRRRNKVPLRIQVIGSNRELPSGNHAPILEQTEGRGGLRQPE